MNLSLRARIVGLIVCAITIFAAVVVYAMNPSIPTNSTTPGASILLEGIPPSLDSKPTLARLTAVGSHRGELVVINPKDPTSAYPVAIKCDRIHATITVGACATTTFGVILSYDLVLFDKTYNVHLRAKGPGIVSRVRVSPGGVFAAVTSFVQGHSYGGNFSTETRIFDASNARTVANLEKFDLRRNGKPERNLKRNFWGVTFVDDDYFYATVGIGDERKLVRGSVRAKRLDMTDVSAECPSISPDGSMIAYKQRRKNDRNSWSLAVLHLGTGKSVVLPGSESVDDQAIWLDNQNLAYAIPDYRTYVKLPTSQQGIVPSNMMSVAADGRSKPKLLGSGIESLVPVRARR
jgi:hypothetical protein